MRQPGQLEASDIPGQVASDSDSAVLTLGQALAMAEVNSPLLKGSLAQLEGAQSGVASARAYTNPESNFLLGKQYERLPTSVPGFMQHYGFSQRIELPSIRKTRIEAAKLNVATSELGLADTRLAVEGAVKRAFFEVLRRQRELELAEEDLQLANDLHRRIAVQVSTGEAARLELTRAEAEITNISTLVKNARLHLLTSKAQLKAAMGSPAIKALEIQGALEPRIELPPLQQLEAEVMAGYPAIRQAEAELSRAQQVLKLERARRAPEPSFVSEYEQQPDLRFFRLGVAIPLPVWDRRQGPIGEATAGVKQAEEVLRQQRLELSTQLEAAYSQYLAADAQLQSFESGAQKAAQAALEAARSAYKFGERSIMEVLDSQRVLHTVNADYLAAGFDRQAALIDLQQLRAIP